MTPPLRVKGCRRFVALVCMCLLTPGAAQALEVEVMHLSADGVQKAVPGLEVSVETWKAKPGPGAERELKTLLNANTDASGRVRFATPAAGTTLETVVVTRHNGVVYKTPLSEVSATTKVAIQLYDSTDSVEQLSGVLTVGLDVRDAFLLVDATLKVTNHGTMVVDTRLGEKGLRVPVALPAVGDAPLEFGVIDPVTGPRHVATRVSPEGGRFQFTGGAVYFEGAVLPGVPTTLQARYAMPIVEEIQDIALSSPIDIERFLGSTSWNDRVAPRVVPDRSFIALGRDPGEQVQRFMRLESPPQAGQPVVIRVDRLPVPLAIFTKVALWGGVALGMLFLFSLVALRQRS